MAVSSEVHSAVRTRRAAGNMLQTLVPFVLMAVGWQIAAQFFPRYLFPSLVDVFWRCLEIVETGAELQQVLATVARILAGMAGAFLIGGALAIVMVRWRAMDRMVSPILTFFQGIPALSWVVFAIIWFKGPETRILFIMIVTTLPAFAFQLIGALRAVVNPGRARAR